MKNCIEPPKWVVQSVSHLRKCNRCFQGLPSRQSPSLPILICPALNAFIVFLYLTGLVVIFNYHLIEKRLMFWWFFVFCFCFPWWHFVIAIICSNVTILTPINLIYKQLVKISKDGGQPAKEWYLAHYMTSEHQVILWEGRMIPRGWGYLGA